eukprot:CAMPEP_0172692588 /NCGR_PEP_ID=MMETSP1074-20121228/25370_1 /TAXON_ID=2916 /ORGANISM="Ceratium fusus, Strain PA161109" /LENGTH=120 /DNA_ID=CAMNT_0013512831 /DNA_START=283 /DNA_END=642 /DNA_ORIENTATION=+
MVDKQRHHCCENGGHGNGHVPKSIACVVIYRHPRVQLPRGGPAAEDDALTKAIGAIPCRRTAPRAIGANVVCTAPASKHLFMQLGSPNMAHSEVRSISSTVGSDMLFMALVQRLAALRGV